VVPIVAAIATLALCLRLYGVDHGHPDFVTGDERAVIKDAVRFVAAGTRRAPERVGCRCSIIRVM
jgi:hypothetical protein